MAYGKSPLDLNAAKIPYDKKQLQTMDRKYQRAYVAIYTANYKRSGKMALACMQGTMLLVIT
ncbi:hypothetical protein SDC49_19400 [Lactobacillus sp. R2/2]|nr:hypothetical protein [Lactobacillus sp. R2/2]MEB3364914.1 hypothetical protein [Lactobacillus sp. R2/2]